MSKEQDMTIRELVEKYGDAAGDWGSTLSDILHDRMREREEDLLAAIDRLERKAATAKAECDAWREHDSPHSGLMAFRAIVEARAATDEAWKEPEDEEPKQ